jgi:N-acetylglucosaminyl-diphospho-decaprenol L-rhamnosyltransferase
MLDLSIVIVNWNVSDLLRRCLASVLAQPAPSAEVIVVDNASSDGSIAMMQAEFPDVTVIGNADNVGFTRANNQAIRRSTGRYVLLLNPDTEVEDGALWTMLAYMDANPQVGAVGPQLFYSDGSVQSSRRRFPDLKTLFVESTILQRPFSSSAILRRYYVLDQPHDMTQDVDWVVGACIMVRRQVIEQVGVLDERFFMYSEETDWCLRMKQAGWCVVYLPLARVVHHEARSSDQVIAAKHIHFQSSKVQYARKHFGPAQAEVLRLFLLATYVLQWFEEGLKRLIGHKRALRAQRMAVYQRVLRSGLRS